MRSWNYTFKVHDSKKVRMIVHADCKNEADDQFALAHHLMTPRFCVRGIIGGHFYRHPQQFQPDETAQASVEEIHRVMALMDMDGSVPVLPGAARPLDNESTPQDSPGARFIIQEAMREDPLPLFIACQGAITDLASAILLEPAICSRMTAIWIGGAAYPTGGFEFNLWQDIAAANVVLQSSMPLWQIPSHVYKQMTVSLAELQYRVAPCGAIGRYLFAQMVEYNTARASSAGWPHGEVWSLGDSPTIGVLLEEVEKTDIYTMVPAPRVRYEDMAYLPGKSVREIRLYHQINARLTLEDFYAKLAINYPPNADR